MALGTRVRDFVFVGHRRCNEAKSVRVHKCVRRPFGFDLRHVAGNALASRRILFVMRVFLESSCARSVRRKRAVAI